MLYKFKSKNTGDIIMLQAHGQRMLEIIGKATVDAPCTQGILLPADMADAITAINVAIEHEEAMQKAAIAEALAQHEPAPKFEAIGLRQRAQPFIDMLRRCQATQDNVVWGV